MILLKMIEAVTVTIVLMIVTIILSNIIPIIPLGG